MFAWWFSPKRAYSVVKIPLACVIVFFFIYTLINEGVFLINAFRQETLFTGVIIFVVPFLAATFFAETILWGGLFYLPYHVLEQEQEGKKALAKSIGILVAVVVALYTINWFVWS